jgi:hypothetical protein
MRLGEATQTHHDQAGTGHGLAFVQAAGDHFGATLRLEINAPRLRVALDSQPFGCRAISR